MPERYSKIGPSIWLQPWSDDARYLAFYLLTCEHRTTEGLYRLPLAYAGEDMHWPLDRVTNALAELEADEFVEYDHMARVVFICRALEWQNYKNPNMAKAGVNAVRDVPPSVLRTKWVLLVEHHAPVLFDLLREQLPEWFVNKSGLLNNPLALEQALEPTPLRNLTTVKMSSSPANFSGDAA